MIKSPLNNLRKLADRFGRSNSQSDLTNGRASNSAIGRRLLRLVFGCYFLIALAVTLTQLVFEYRNAKSEIFVELSEMGQTFENNLVQGLWNYDIDQIDSALSGIEKSNLVKATKITTGEGEEISGTFRSLIDDSSNYKQRNEGSYGIGSVVQYSIPDGSNGDTVYEYKFPLIYKNTEQKVDDLVGFGYFYTDHSHIIANIKYSFFLIIANSIIKTLALWAIFLFFVNRVISVPLKILTNAAKKYDPQNVNLSTDDIQLDKITNRKSSDELSTLVNSFRLMQKSVSDSFETINSQNENLEQRVFDRTEAIEKVNKQLEHLSLHDILTELPNRKLFEGKLDELLLNSSNESDHFAVGYIDLRKFKRINDSMGHQAGDFVLQELASRMASVVGDSGLIARMGGDEFATIFHCARHDQVRAFADKLLSCSLQPILFEEQKIYSGLNIGFSIFPDHGITADELLKKADTAMYQAKQNDRGMAIYSENVQDGIIRNEKIKAAIAEKAFLDQLSVFYQPVITSHDKSIKGLEALVRWKHPELFSISPDEFIPIAERSSAIKHLTAWVCLQSIRDALALLEQGYQFSVSINFPGQLLHDGSFIEELHQMLLDTQINPEQLIFEITESIGMKNPEFNLHALKRLKDIGIKISIDDFGIGYSSFAYLARLPLDEIKIDRSFLLDSSSRNKVVIQSIINVAHKLDLKVVAKGVEDEETIHTLDTLDCDYVQGYYYSPPMDFNALVEWVEGYETARLVDDQRKKAG